MKIFLGLILVLVMALGPAKAFATDSYSDATEEKLEGGVTNTLLGWTKIFSVPHDYQVEKKNPWAGVGKGVVDAIHCTVTGAFNLLTFPLPAEMSSVDGCVDLDSKGTPQNEDWEGGKTQPATTPAAVTK